MSLQNIQGNHGGMGSVGDTKYLGNPGMMGTCSRTSRIFQEKTPVFLFLSILNECFPNVLTFQEGTKGQESGNSSFFPSII